jgi:hypothetical protein
MMPLMKIDTTAFSRRWRNANSVLPMRVAACCPFRETCCFLQHGRAASMGEPYKGLINMDDRALSLWRRMLSVCIHRLRLGMTHDCVSAQHIPNQCSVMARRPSPQGCAGVSCMLYALYGLRIA